MSLPSRACMNGAGRWTGGRVDWWTGGDKLRQELSGGRQRSGGGLGAKTNPVFPLSRTDTLELFLDAAALNRMRERSREQAASRICVFRAKTKQREAGRLQSSFSAPPENSRDNRLKWKIYQTAHLRTPNMICGCEGEGLTLSPRVCVSVCV